MSHALVSLGVPFSPRVSVPPRRGDRAVRQKGRMLCADYFAFRCVRTMRACVRARMRHGCRGARRMRDLQLGPDHGGRRSREKHRSVESRTTTRRWQ